jgi:DNA-3-methyladenine glycosylase II
MKSRTRPTISRRLEQHRSERKVVKSRAQSSFFTELKPIAPFRLDFTVWALRRRPENLVDRWDGTTYRRVLLIRGESVEISVSQRGSNEAPRLEVNVTGSLSVANVKSEVSALLIDMLGLQVDLKPFYTMAGSDPKLRRLAEKYRGLKPVRLPTVFETLVSAIACQQFTLAAGLRLLDRLARLGRVAIENESGIVFGFPEPSDLLRVSPQTFRRLGFSRQKTQAFRELSQAILAGPLELQKLEDLSNQAAIDFLLALRGVGRWTAEYVLLRGLGRLDVFPGDDVGARNRLTQWLRLRKPMDYAGVKLALDRWQPYAGFIYFHMLMESLNAAGRLNGT